MTTRTTATATSCSGIRRAGRLSFKARSGTWRKRRGSGTGRVSGGPKLLNRCSMHALQWIENEGKWLRQVSASVLRRRLGRARKRCTWCGRVVPGRRKTWCSSRCFQEFAARCDRRTVRGLVLDRDHGICRLCGRDTLKALQFTSSMILAGKLFYRIMGVCKGTPARKCGEHCLSPVCRMLREQLWEMDHIIPVVEGGGLCALSNYRTLCKPCHKVQTAALAKRLKRRKRR